MQEKQTTEREERRYRTIRKLAEGGNGTAYLVWDKRLDKSWVMKCVPLHGAEQREAVTREITALKQIHKEGIPVLADVVHEQGQICLIMEYMTGMSLQEKITQEGMMEEREAVCYALQAAELVRFLHRLPTRMIHGDLKPLNLVFHNGKAALLDFGGAVSLNHEQTEPCCYTPGYGAPELLAGGGPSERTDIYAFGALLFYLVTGEDPAASRGIYPVREQRPLLSKRLERLILQCTAPQAADRPGSMDEVIAELKDMDEAFKLRGVKGWKSGEDKSRRRKKERVFRLIRDVLLTEGRWGDGSACRAALLVAAGLWYAAGLAGLTKPVQAAEAAGPMKSAQAAEVAGPMRSVQATDTLLPVCIRNRAGEKLLVDFTAVYHTEENLIFELPAKCFERGKEYEVTIRQKERRSGTQRERTFVICAD